MAANADFGNESDDGVVGLVPYEIRSSSEDSFELPTKSKRRKKRAQTENSNWFAAKNKNFRQTGKQYLGKRKEGAVWNYGKVKKARSLKRRCGCVDKVKASIIKCGNISESVREDLFKEFWKMSWDEKKLYVKTLVHSIPPKRPRHRVTENTSKRTQSLQYHFRVNNKILRVCRTFFLNTLNIGRNTVMQWVQKPQRKKPMAKVLPQSAQRQNLEQFFDALPATESHYCRSQTTKKYLLSEWRSKAMLYDFYVKNWCHEQNKQPLSITVFNNIFQLKNLSLFAPKKDQCNICSRHNVENYSPEKYILHQEMKNEARDEKNKDKAEQSYVFTVDLQAVLLAPKANVSSFYYRTKIQVHNLVFYNVKNKEAYCFLWNEVEGGLTSEDFASVWTYFIEKKILPNLQDNTGPVNIIFYSDGCTYQNRNCCLSNSLLNISIANNINIIQKILETGHTQMEADSVHSVIERALKNRTIDVPAEYASVCKNARKNPKPYDVTYLDYKFFKSFTNLNFVNSIRPGRGTGDSKVTDIRALKYTPKSEIFYKLQFSHEWNILPQRINKGIVPLTWSQLTPLYNERRRITKRKYEDLQILKTTLAKDYHKYYEDLPHN